MKTIKLIICYTFVAATMALSISGPAHADKTQRCIGLSTLFEVTAGYRDMGLSPERSYLEAVQTFVVVKDFELTNEIAKVVVNTVYFDEGFFYAGGMALQKQIYDLCMRNFQPKFQPLR